MRRLAVQDRTIPGEVVMKPMNEGEEKEFAEEVFEQFGPMLKIAQALAPEIAKTHRIMFEELKKAGFTEDQALQICSRQSGVGGK